AGDLHRGHRGEQQQRLHLGLGQGQVIGQQLAGRDVRRNGERAGGGDAHGPDPARTNCSLPPVFWVAPVCRSTCRRMSRMGSTERTRGMTSKLLTGGGEETYHSSVLPFHGSGPARRPTLRLRTTLTMVSRMPAANTNEPTVE